MHRPRVRLGAASVIATAITALGALTATGSSAYAATPHTAPVTARPGGVPAPKLFWTAAAVQTGSIFHWRNGATGLCLDDSARYGLRVFGCNDPSYNNGYQKWTVVNHNVNMQGKDIVQMQNGATGLCLDDSAERGLRVFGCNDPSFNNGYQAWTINYSDPSSKGPVQLENRITGLCLDDSARYGLREFGCNYSSYLNGYQAWSS